MPEILLKHERDPKGQIQSFHTGMLRSLLFSRRASSFAGLLKESHYKDETIPQFVVGKHLLTYLLTCNPLTHSLTHSR